MRIIFSILLSVTFLNSLFANSEIATVEKIRGTVSILRPGALSASQPKEGDNFLEDTSILTKESSFIRLKLIDGSIINLGPNSKIILTRLNLKDGNVLSLLKGNVRSSIIPAPSGENKKFFVRTRTAALGVRGTEFHTIYNPENNNTSLLTYKGEVAMVKHEGSFDKLGESGNLKTEDPKDMESLLKSKDAVKVKAGQYSGALATMQKSTLPVKVAPDQLSLLYKNEEMIDPKEKISQTAETPKPKALFQAAQDVPAEGFADAKNGLFAPRAGGFIDINTGLYVAPLAGGNFDEKNGVYTPDKVGTIDVLSGNYIPPKGLVLDPREGFKVADNTLDAKKREEIVVIQHDLNQSLKASTELAKESEFLAIEGSDSNRYDGVILSLGPIQDKYRLTKIGGLAFSPTSLEVESSGGKELKLAYLHEIGSTIRPITGILIKDTKYSVDYNSSGNGMLSSLSTPNGKLWGLFLGLKYTPFKRHTFTAEFNYAEEYVPELTLNSNGYMYDFKFIKMANTSLQLIWEPLLYSTSRFRLSARAGAIYYPKQQAEDLRLKAAFGSDIGINGTYYLRPRTSLTFSIDSKNHTRGISTANYNAELRRVTNTFLLSGQYLF